jgi:hypothetical protein
LVSDLPHGSQFTVGSSRDSRVPKQVLKWLGLAGGMGGESCWTVLDVQVLMNAAPRKHE